MNMKSLLLKKLKYIPLFLVLFIPLSQGANYVVGVEELEYLPHYTVKRGEYEGFARDLLDAFAKSKGHTFTYKPRPVARLYSEFLKKNKFDFKYPDNAYWSADDKKGKNVQYSNAVAKNIEGLMVLPGKKGSGIDNFKYVGTIKGFDAWGLMEQIKSGKIVMKETKTFIDLLKKVFSKRIDGAYLNIDVAKYQLNKIMKKPGTLVFDDSLPNISGTYHLSTRKHPSVIAEFNEFLTQEKAIVDAIKTKYNIK